MTPALVLQVLDVGEQLLARAPSCLGLYSHALELLAFAGEHQQNCALRFLEVGSCPSQSLACPAFHPSHNLESPVHARMPYMDIAWKLLKDLWPPSAICQPFWTAAS